MEIEIKTEQNEVIFYENGRITAKLVKLPGGKKMPFGKSYEAYSIDFLAGITSNEDKAIETLRVIVEYGYEHNAAVVNQMYGLKSANFKTADATREIYKELGFFVDRSCLWYIP